MEHYRAPDVLSGYRAAGEQRADHLNEHDQARLASPSSSTPTQGCEPAEMPSKNSTASTSPTTTMAPSKLSTGSLTSTPPANLASSTPSSTPSLPGATRSWPGTVRAGPPTAESKEPTTSSRSYAARRSRLHQPRQLRRPRTPRDMITPPKPVDRSPRIRRRANKTEKQ